MITRTYWSITRDNQWLFLTDKAELLWTTCFHLDCLLDYRYAKALQKVYAGSELKKFYVRET